MGSTSAKIASALVIYLMAIRSRAELLTFLALFLLIFIVFFALFSQLLGVPLWWIFRGLPLLSTRAEPLNVTVAPGPYSVGDRIPVTVRAAVGGYPMENASVAVYRDGELMYSVLTNSAGQAVIRYPGETTVIIISKEGYFTETRVLPEIPRAWVRNKYVARVFSAIAAFVILYLAVYRRATYWEGAQGCSRSPRRR